MNIIEIRPGSLMPLELETLMKIGGCEFETIVRTHWETGEKKEVRTFKVQCIIAYVDRDGSIQIGPVRCRQVNCWVNADGTREDYWEVSPFTGAWTSVPVRQILRVQSLDSNGNIL